jgi:hypothetical protein
MFWSLSYDPHQPSALENLNEAKRRREIQDQRKQSSCSCAEEIRKLRQEIINTKSSRIQSVQ